MSKSQPFLHDLGDMGCLLGTVVRTTLKYKRGPCVHCKGLPNMANIDSSSRRAIGNTLKVPELYP